MIPYPGSPEHQSVTLQPIVSALANTAELTGSRQAVDMGASWWEAEIAVAPMYEEEARRWRLFLGRARGVVNTFRVPITAGAQIETALTVRAQGVGSGYTLLTDGWPVSSTPLPAGDYVTVGDQLMVVDEDVETNASGVATLQFHSPLRGTVADNTLIEVNRPFLRAYLPDGSPALTLTPGQIQAGFSFTVMEAF